MKIKFASKPRVLLAITLFSLASFFLLRAPAPAHAFTITKPADVTGLVGWWTMDALDTVQNIRDRSGQGNTGYLFGFTSTTTTPGKRGEALTFTTGGQFIGINVGGGSLPLSAPFTFCAWIKPTSVVLRYLYSRGIESIGAGLQFIINATGKLDVDNYGGATLSNSSIVANVWTHVCAEGFGAAGVNLYINGVLDKTGNSARNWATGSATQTIGAYYYNAYSGNDYSFNGLMDDVRVYNRALSTAQVNNLFNLSKDSHVNTSKGTAKGPAGLGLNAGLVGYWTFDGADMVGGAMLDKSGNGNTANFVNIASSTFFTQGKMGQAGNFDGVDDYLDTNSGTNIVNAQQAISVSAWVYLTAAGSYPAIAIKSSAFNETTAKYAFYLDASTQQPKFSMGGSAAPFHGSAVPLNKWVHVVYVNGPSGYVIYENGASNATGSALPAPTSSSDSWKIGSWIAGSGMFPGILDDVRIYNRSLSAAEVTQLYNLGTNTHINTTQNSKLTSGLVGEWSFDGPDMINNVTDRSGNGNDAFLHFGTLGNTSTSSMVRSGKIGQALQFDGVDDYIVTKAIDLTGTNKVSLSMWLYRSAFSNDDKLAAEFTNNANNFTTGFNLDLNFSPGSCCSAIGLVGNTGVTSKYTTRPAGGVWHHYVAIYDKSQSAANEVSLYIDGGLQSLVIDHVNDNTNNFGNDNLYLMSRGGSSLFSDGAIDDVRLYNRVLNQAEVTQLYGMGKGTR